METPQKMDKSTSTSSALKMELMKGKEYATQLQALLDNSIIREDEDSALAQQLAHNVFGSFNDSLVKLHLFKSLLDSTQIRPDNVVDRASAGFDIGFQHYDGGKKRLVEVGKNRRGCYRRRGQSESSSFTVSPIMDDGYAWRKYGQKGILYSKYPRCYFRCTHKHDQGCKATKQVQKVDDEQEKSIYQTTYFGHHTCQNLTGDPEIIVLDSETTYQSTNMICFQEKAKQVAISTVKVKQEVSKGGETQSEVTTDDNISSNISNEVIWHDDELRATGSSDMMEYYPKIEFIQNHEVASSSGSLVDLDIKTFDADIELFQW